jgi:hypothetical protein
LRDNFAQSKGRRMSRHDRRRQRRKAPASVPGHRVRDNKSAPFAALQQLVLTELTNERAHRPVAREPTAASQETGGVIALLVSTVTDLIHDRGGTEQLLA